MKYATTRRSALPRIPASASILAGACAAIISGCQSIPADLAGTDIIAHAEDTFDVTGVSRAYVEEYSASKIFTATYTEQHKATVTLPSAADVFGMYSEHCEARSGVPTLIDGVSMVCSKNGEILYNLNAAQITKSRVAMQIVQPMIQGAIRTDPQFISDYGVRFFSEHLASVGSGRDDILALGASDRRQFGIQLAPYDR